MFTTKISRAAQRATSSAVVVSSPSSSSALSAQRSTQCISTASTRRTHQRRHSSSKASCPPDSSSKPAPDAKAAAEEGTKSPASERSQRRASRYNKRPGGEQVVKTKDIPDQFAGLPTVPGVQHLRDYDYGLSSFFSLHRPLSLTTTIPPPATEDAFSNIFSVKQEQDPWANGNSAERKPEDVIYTLHNTIESLEGGANSAQEDGVRWEVIQESPTNSEGVKHLDSAPRLKSLEELVAQFRPFQAPPAPQAFPEEKKSAEKKRGSRQAKNAQQTPKQKSYTTTIVVTESFTPDGQRTYSASSSPIVRLPDPEEETLSQTTMQLPSAEQKSWQPYRARRRAIPRMAQESSIAEPTSTHSIREMPASKKPSMHLISVKRQRKLKMKKHKYKKLMKRTRTLRRRLDRT